MLESEKKIPKNEMIRNVMTVKPGASISEIKEMVRKHYGSNISKSHVIRTRQREGVPPIKAVSSNNTKNNDNISIEAIRTAKSLIDQVGSVESAKRLVEIMGE